MKGIVLEFRKAKETKGTWRFEEIEAAGRDAVVGSLYVQKAALAPSGNDRGTRPNLRLKTSKGAE